MYFPIYSAVAKKFHIDWYLLWINHKKESWTSSSIKAFNGGTYPYFGGWQRNVLIWSQKYVDKAFEDLEYLAKIKTKNKSDAPEAAAAGAMLGPNVEKYTPSLGKEKAVLYALIIFTGGISSAQERTDMWKKCHLIFDSK